MILVYLVTDGNDTYCIVGLRYFVDHNMIRIEGLLDNHSSIQSMIVVQNSLLHLLASMPHFVHDRVGFCHCNSVIIK